METTKTFPSGYGAVWQGRRFLANGGRAGKITLRDPETGQDVRTVPIGELDEWYATHTEGTYLGEPFRVNAEIDGTHYWITYEGGNGIRIAEEWRARQDSEPNSAFWREDQYTFMARVPKGEVTALREIRRDALGPWRARQAKGSTT
jgi:hypothetical protein